MVAIQSDAAEAALDRNPALAREPLRVIHGSAKEALAEMRRLLGVLRDDEDGAELGPLPGLAQAEKLVERTRAAGIAVDFAVAGQARPLPASVDLSAYRILQEALTNVRKHAPGAAVTVHVAWRPDLLEIAVRDTGGIAPAAAQNDAGQGLVGMRERVRLHGGTLRASRVAEGGFEVVAALPIPQPS